MVCHGILFDFDVECVRGPLMFLIMDLLIGAIADDTNFWVFTTLQDIRVVNAVHRDSAHSGRVRHTDRSLISGDVHLCSVSPSRLELSNPPFLLFRHSF